MHSMSQLGASFLLGLGRAVAMSPEKIEPVCQRPLSGNKGIWFPRSVRENAKYPPNGNVEVRCQWMPPTAARTKTTSPASKEVMGGWHPLRTVHFLKRNVREFGDPGGKEDWPSAHIRLPVAIVSPCDARVDRGQSHGLDAGCMRKFSNHKMVGPTPSHHRRPIGIGVFVEEYVRVA